jgi:hypothetical protein
METPRKEYKVNFHIFKQPFVMKGVYTDNRLTIGLAVLNVLGYWMAWATLSIFGYSVCWVGVTLSCLLTFGQNWEGQIHGKFSQNLFNHRV